MKRELLFYIHVFAFLGLCGQISGQTRARTTHASGSVWSIKARDSVRSIHTGPYDPLFEAPPKNVPTPKTPDAPLAGNGVIALCWEVMVLRPASPAPFVSATIR